MLKRLLRAVTITAALLLLALGSITALAQGGEAKLRFVHAIPGGSPVDVYTDGQLTIKGLTFGSASTYVNVTAGDHQLSVTPSGVNNPLWQQTISASGGSALTLVAATATEPNFIVYVDDLNPLPLGKARFTAIHAISGGPAVDVVLADGTPVLPGLQFGFQQQPGTLDVPAFAYPFAVVPAGEGVANALVTPPTASLNSGTSYMLMVYGTLEQPAALLLAAPTAPEVDGGFVRLAHGVSGASAVDVLFNESVVGAGLNFGDLTEHFSVPAGTYDVAVRAAGSEQSLLSATLTIEAGTAVTLAALGTPAELTAAVLPDSITGIAPEQARLALINGIAGDSTISATLADGTTLASEVAFGAAGAAVDIAPSEQSLSLSVNIGEASSTIEVPATSFYGGVYYDLVVVDNAGQIELLTAPTSLAQSAASAPGAAPAVVEVAVQPTLPPPPEATAAAPEPTQPPPPTPVPATPVGPTGRVFNLNPDANLQLRQYPHSQALSLGTVPLSTVLTINGRAGAIEPIPFSATPQPPEDYEFVDPATELEENADLVPEETWLNVTYNTPDGGIITAWANALYVDVRNPRGDRMRLADLPLVASNLPGEVDNTGVTPPPVPQNRVAAIVFNLDPGVNLNIRRTATNDGEVLARVPTGTVMEFVGLKQDGQWVFVSYTTPEGGIVTGWVNALYIQYQFNNNAIDLEEMDERGLLVITPDDTRGELRAGAAPAGIPTADPVRNAFLATVVLDPGSNLNLRRNPNPDAEVLAQIPSGTQVIVSTRTGDERWLNVTFEGVTGWIAAKTDTAVFVRITRNGREASITDIPVQEGDTTTPAPSQLTATPTDDLIQQRLPVRVTDVLVQMTGSPGGSADGLPIITQGMEAFLLFTDGTFSYIELAENMIRGWVPAGSVQPR